MGTALLENASPYAKMVAKLGLQQLTNAERRVLRCILNDEPTKVSAKTLQVSPRTVEMHRQRVFHKLGADTPLALFKLLVDYKLPADLTATLDGEEADVGGHVEDEDTALAYAVYLALKSRPSSTRGTTAPASHSR